MPSACVIALLYSSSVSAHRATPTKWEYYDSKIKLLEKSLEGVDDTDDKKKWVLKQIGDTKLAAVKGLVKNMDFFSTDEYIEFAKKIFQVRAADL